jgi:hypothetical protein
MHFFRLSNTYIPKYFVCSTNTLQNNTMEYFPIEKSLAAKVTLLFGRSVNGMYVPSIMLQILDKPMMSLKSSIIAYNRFVEGILI